MRAVVTENTNILIPNPSHKNFTRSHEMLAKGTEVNGEAKNITGLKRNEPFVYKLFYTDKNQIIYLKNIKPMEKTEVTLGADSAQSPTKINLPGVSNLGKRPVIGALVGAGIGFAYCKYKKHDMKKTAMYALIGGFIGFMAGKYIQSHKKVTVVPSK